MKLSSCNVYGHDLHIHWLHSVTDNPSIINKFTSIARYIFSGRSMPAWAEEYMNSDEYQAIHHQCDIASGEYIRLLKPYARQLMIDTGLIPEANWGIDPNHPEIKDYPDFFQNKQQFGGSDIARQAWVYIDRKAVEDYVESLS